LLLFSGLAFFVMLSYLKRTPTITLDTDWVWRRLLPAAAGAIEAMIGATGRVLRQRAGQVGNALLSIVSRQAGHEARLARTWATRSMALWVLVLLLGYLVLYYV